MARIRTIKPEFWTDEEIVELDYEHRLLFIGLWNFADDQGFFTDRPKRIKMQIFPGDNVDVEGALDTLWRAGLLTLYGSDEGRIWRITNWERHQRVSNPSRERYSLSDLREHPRPGVSVQSTLESYPAEGREGKEGKEGNKGANSRESTPNLPEHDEQFTRFLQTHPNINNPTTTYKAWVEATKHEQPERIIECAANYRAHTQRERTEPRYIKRSANWLNERAWLNTNAAAPPPRELEEWELRG